MSTQSLPRSHVADILSRIVGPEEGDFPPEAAKAVLKLKFAERDRKRAHELSVKAGEGSLTDEERSELDAYQRVSRLVDLLWLKAERSLKQAGLDPSEIGR